MNLISSLKGKKSDDCKYGIKMVWHHSTKILSYLQQIQDANFVVVGFPANNFGHKSLEPQWNYYFCESTIMTFPIMCKKCKGVICVKCTSFDTKS
jgi:glutathione peroxidase-family protein